MGEATKASRVREACHALRHAATVRAWAGPSRSLGMNNTPALSLSTSERQTLRYIAQGQLDPRELDWLALQRLKRAGLIEERGTAPGITAEGRRALQRLLAKA